MSTGAFPLCSRRLYDVSPRQQHDLDPVESACRGRHLTAGCRCCQACPGNALIRLALPCRRHIARVTPPPRGIMYMVAPGMVAAHRGWDSFKCLNYLMKSTKTSVAISSRSCGTSILSISYAVFCLKK